MTAEQLAEDFKQILTGFQKTFAQTQDASAQQVAALTAAIKSNSQHVPTGYNTKPPVFRGEGTDDLDQFLQSFNLYADFYNWSDPMRLKALPLNLQGRAKIWFNSLETASFTSYPELVKLLKDHFNSGASEWLVREELDQRKQGQNESVTNYSDDIRRLCQRLNLPKTEWRHAFVRGLRSELRSHVVPQQPATYEQAENLAALKEALSKNEPSVASLTKELQETLHKFQNDSGSASHQQTVAAYEMTNANDQLPITGGEIRRLIQREIRSALRDTHQGNSFTFNRRPTNGGHYSRTPDFLSRNRRTPQGVPICNNCGRRGHTVYNCYQRDPRIPRDSRAQTPRNPSPPHNRSPQGN